MEYLAALELQERLVESKQREASADILLFVEHPHVYTLGRGGKESNVLAPEEVPVIRTSRGGDVTYHGPGQLVVYPIIDLRSKLRKDVHRYVRNLELSRHSHLERFRTCWHAPSALHRHLDWRQKDRRHRRRGAPDASPFTAWR